MTPSSRLFILALEENDGRVRRVEKRFPWDSFRSMKPEVAGAGMLQIMQQLETEMGGPVIKPASAPQSPANLPANAPAPPTPPTPRKPNPTQFKKGWNKVRTSTDEKVVDKPSGEV